MQQSLTFWLVEWCDAICGVKRKMPQTWSRVKKLEQTFKWVQPYQNIPKTRFTPMRFPTVTNLTTLLTVSKFCCIKAPKNFHHFHVFPDSSHPKKKGCPPHCQKVPGMVWVLEFCVPLQTCQNSQTFLSGGYTFHEISIVELERWWRDESLQE